MSNVTFEAGDVVTCAFFGDEEFVLKTSLSSEYPLCFYAPDGCRRSFSENGKFHVTDIYPILKLVRKKTKKRTVVELFKVNSENESFFLNNNEFGSYDDALDWIKSNGVNGWVYSIDKFYKINDL